MNFEALKEQYGEDAVKEAFMLGVIQGIKQAQEWRPIETAPKDGREVLVYRPLAEKTNDERVAVKRAFGEHRGCRDTTVPEGQVPYNPTSELVQGEIGWSTEPCTTNVLRYVREDLQDEEMINVSLRDHLAGLRDQIAIAYMQAKVQAGGLYETWGDLSGDAYKTADAMLKERANE